MAPKTTPHPPQEKLRAFAQGTLVDQEFRQVEEHLAQCDTCCDSLAGEPAGTLLELAREAVAGGLNRPSQPANSAADANAIPAPLQNHPRYRIVEKIGSGGMGAVYKAEHRIMQRTVALKVVHPWMLSHPQAVERFHREVRMAAKLTHPNIVAAYDADDAGELHSLIMEFVDGESLDRRLGEGKVVSLAHACDWIRQAALGLQFAHEQGMVHRDIKPQNLMLTREGVVKILDFGLTRMVQDAELANSPTVPEHATREGMILGTPDYIPPEQIIDSRSADTRSDIYSLGCTFYCLLTGKPPFAGGTTIDKLHAHGARGVPRLEPDQLKLPAGWPREIATQVCEIVRRMTELDPAQRFATPGEVAKALSKVLQGAKQAMQNPAARASVTPPPLPVVVERSTPAAHVTVTVPATTNSLTKKKPFLTPLQMGLGGLALFCGLLLPFVYQRLGGTPEKGGSAIADVPRPVPQIPPDPTKANASVEERAARIMLLIPSRGLWLADYKYVADEVQRLKGQKSGALQLEVVGTTRQPALLAPGSLQGRVVPDRILDAQVRASDYDALIVVGYDTSEFVPGGSFGSQVERLLQEFAAQNKPVASLCAGQRILLEHGFARGKRVATCEFVLPQAVAAAGANIGSGRVVQDGILITATADQDAPQLLRNISNLLQP